MPQHAEHACGTLHHMHSTCTLLCSTKLSSLFRAPACDTPVFCLPICVGCLPICVGCLPICVGCLPICVGCLPSLLKCHEGDVKQASCALLGTCYSARQMIHLPGQQVTSCLRHTAFMHDRCLLTLRSFGIYCQVLAKHVYRAIMEQSTRPHSRQACMPKHHFTP